MIEKSSDLFGRFTVAGDPARSDYLMLIKEIVSSKQQDSASWQTVLQLRFKKSFLNLASGLRISSR